MCSRLLLRKYTVSYTCLQLNILKNYCKTYTSMCSHVRHRTITNTCLTFSGSLIFLQKQRNFHVCKIQHIRECRLSKHLNHNKIQQWEHRGSDPSVIQTALCIQKSFGAHWNRCSTEQNIRVYTTGSQDNADRSKPKSKISGKQFEVIWTVPNALTVSRIILSPLLGYLVLEESFGLACGLFLFAGLTDLVDGWIARKYPSQMSAFGSFIDPLADKILITILFVTLTTVKLIPLPLALLVIGRDIGLVIAAFYVRYISLIPPISFRSFFDATHATAQLKPMMISKLNTAVQLSLVTVTLAAPVLGFIDHEFLHYLWYITAATTAASGIGYIFAKDTFKLFHRKASKRDQ